MRRLDMKEIQRLTNLGRLIPTILLKVITAQQNKSESTYDLVGAFLVELTFNNIYH